jgi:hypothetical protein
MVQPFGADYKPKDVPLSQYWQDSSYDTAAQCEAAKAAMPDNALRKAKTGAKMKDWWTAMAGAVLAGSCVATDDPRLAQ